MNTTKRIILSVALIILIKGFSTAQNHKIEDALLWEVTGGQLESNSWIFGTIHMICLVDIVVFPGMKDALKQSGKLVIEIDISDPVVYSEMQQSMIMSDGAELEDLLEYDDYRLVKRFFSDSLGIELGLLSSVQPFFLGSMIYPHMVQCTPKSYEDYLISEAKELGIPISALETVQEQFDVFEYLPYEKQADLLLESIENYSQKREEFKTMVSDYLDQKLNKLYEDMESSILEMGSFSGELLEERNHRWIPRIEKLISEQSAFIAVGAAHLPGEEGVIKLLRNKGYKVEPAK